MDALYSILFRNITDDVHDSVRKNIVTSFIQVLENRGKPWKMKLRVSNLEYHGILSSSLRNLKNFVSVS